MYYADTAQDQDNPTITGKDMYVEINHLAKMSLKEDNLFGSRREARD